MQAIYKKDYAKFNLPICELMSKEILSLPIGPHMPKEDVDYIIQTINNFTN
jgi:dTDP-4-amino-4,6-dideoxygalactose transaminase